MGARELVNVPIREHRVIKWPTKLTGASPFTRWINQFLAASKSAELVEGPDYTVQRKPTGTQLRFKTGGAESGGTYKTFKLCRNGQSITVEIDSKQDPATEPDPEA